MFVAFVAFGLASGVAIGRLNASPDLQKWRRCRGLRCLETEQTEHTLITFDEHFRNNFSKF